MSSIVLQEGKAHTARLICLSTDSGYKKISHFPTCGLCSSPLFNLHIVWVPKVTVTLLFPGLFSNHGPLYFVGTKRFFSKMGLACHIAKIHSEVINDYSVFIMRVTSVWLSIH